MVHCSVRDSIGVMDPWPTGSEWAQSTTYRPFCPVVMVADTDHVLETVIRTSTQYSVLMISTRFLVLVLV